MRKNKEFELFGIVGYPLAHTLSPVMHEAAFSKLGLKAFYLALELDPRLLKQALRGLSSFALGGFNVTVPYKETVLSALRNLRPEARSIGAVNTVYRSKGKWCGANTDAEGFLLSLKNEKGFAMRSKHITLLGAGGACRAVSFAAGSQGAASVRIANRHPRRAKKVTEDFKKIFPKVHFESSDLLSLRNSDWIRQSDLVINTTSLGLKEHDASPLEEALIPPATVGGRKLFVDLIYNPPRTRFLQAASASGHDTLNGLGMLVYQGAKSFELWTGKKAPVREMFEAAQQALQEKA